MRIGILALLAGCSDYNLKTEAEVLPGSPLLASGPRSWSQTWELASSQSDILFFGDTSGSMAEELTTMGAEVTSFVQDLAAYAADWQLLAVTGPDGCGVGGVMDVDTPDFAALFAASLLTPPGADEVDEWGLHNAYQAVLQAAPGGCNEGFLRDGASLHIVFISDEDDNSPGWDSGDAEYWRTYIDGILSAKAGAGEVTFSAIAGPWPKGCEGAEPGTGYWQAVESTSGQFLTICEEWATKLTDLAEATVQRKEFPLERVPDPETVEVLVNDVEQPETWSYVPASNAVVFSAEFPSNGDTVLIRYEIVE